MQKRTLLIMFMSTSLAFGHYQHLKPIGETGEALIGATVVAATVGATLVYLPSVITLALTAHTFRNEEKYKNRFFFNFKPSDRLICKWGLDVWPSNEEMISFAGEHKEEFALALQNAARGNYFIRTWNIPHFLLAFYRDLVSELNMIAQRRQDLIFVKNLAFGLRDKAKKWLDTLDFYEKRLEIIKPVILEMPEYQQQVKDWDERELIKGAWNTNVYFDRSTN